MGGELKIAILGAGAYGMALGGVLAENEHQISYYDPMKFNISLDDALKRADAMLLAVPSNAVIELIKLLPKTRPLIVATKGFLSKEIFNEFDELMIISGPGFAEDIAKHRPTKLTTTDMRVINWMSTDYLTFDITSDVDGVLMCGALKNVYAILAGMRKLVPGFPEWKDYLKIAAEEMCMILEANGASPKTVALACGVGDLAATCTPKSRNFQYGEALARGTQSVSNDTLEGVETLKRIRDGGLKIPDDAVNLKEILEKSQTWG